MIPYPPKNKVKKPKITEFEILKQKSPLITGFSFVQPKYFWFRLRFSFWFLINPFPVSISKYSFASRNRYENITV